MTKSKPKFSVNADGHGSNISFLLQIGTDSRSLVKICGLMRTQKFQDPHISEMVL